MENTPMADELRIGLEELLRKAQLAQTSIFCGKGCGC
jgi:hypothetical protein